MPEEHGDIPPPPYQRHATSTSASSHGAGRMIDPYIFTSPTSAILDSSASWSNSRSNGNGKIELSINIKEDKFPDLTYGITPTVKEYAAEKDARREIPPSNIVVFYLGTEANLIPLRLIALKMIKSHSHRVRISTQETHRDTILQFQQRLDGLRGRDGEELEGKLEFYDVLAGPNFSLKSWADDPQQMESTLRSFYKSTYLPNSSTGAPFAADLIIAHPDTLAHVHLGELYGIPVHIVSDKPISPTISIAHPSSNPIQSNAGEGLTNYLSYALVDNLIWQNLGRAIKKNFRQVPLGLELKIPITNLWDEGILGRPDDWREHIDIAGFVFDDSKGYRPDEGLLGFLKDAGKVIYMGYGAILSIKGMSTAGEMPSEVFILEDQNASSWLLGNEKVSAVIYDGSGKSTVPATSCSVLLLIWPISSFWSNRLFQLGAFPRPIPIEQVSVEFLSVALDEALSSEIKANLKELAGSLSSEDGVQKSVESIHRHLPSLNMRCDIAPGHAATFYHPKFCLLLSGVVAGVLAEEGKLEYSDLALNRPKEYASTQADSDPIIGGAQAFFMALSNSVKSVRHLFSEKPPSREVDISSQQQYSIYNEQFPLVDTVTGPGPKPITDFKSGMKEARREMVEGVKDGVKGFVNGPLDPLKRGNLVGGVFGLVGGSLVTNPLSGAIRSLESTTRGISSELSKPNIYKTRLAPTAASSPADVLRKPRVESSKAESKFVSGESRKMILNAWRKVRSEESIRKRRMRRDGILRGVDVSSFGRSEGIDIQYIRGGGGENVRESKDRERGEVVEG
uniref:UDP-glucose,sterol transferase n=1 Tax=Kwoniella bestiolae CBS 10118 TaxID=1296100 RepID=A0A1B9FVH9_9TREE|nr:hypothetical protein I302_07128 [Kwoniella bestiolae CBS 10118]OCF22787.1 hypothetical protein I302_07128 [Kwoniella bestiolae CBS 10118]